MFDVRFHEKTGALSSRHLLNEVESYWRDLFRARRIPARSDVNPVVIDTALPHSFIAQRVAPGVARIRVSGQGVNGHLGLDPRGMPLCSLFTPKARAEMTRKIEMVFDGPHLVELPLVSPRGLGRPALDARLLMLPLRDGDDRVTRMLGVLVADAGPSSRPRRFQICDGARRIEPIALRLAPTLVLDNGDAADGQDKGPDTPRHPALKLVVSNG